MDDEPLILLCVKIFSNLVKTKKKASQSEVRRGRERLTKKLRTAKRVSFLLLTVLRVAKLGASHANDIADKKSRSGVGAND